MDVSDIDVSKPRGRRAIAAAANAAMRTVSPAPAPLAAASDLAVAASAATSDRVADRVRAERAVERALLERAERGAPNKCTIKRDRTVVRLRTKKVRGRGRPYTAQHAFVVKIFMPVKKKNCCLDKFFRGL